VTAERWYENAVLEEAFLVATDDIPEAEPSLITE
jgi:hypothetical protein